MIKQLLGRQLYFICIETYLQSCSLFRNYLYFTMILFNIEWHRLAIFHLAKSPVELEQHRRPEGFKTG